MVKDKTLIPPGPYCYTYLPDNEQPKDLPYPTKLELCPYYRRREINGTFVPWCDYLNLGGIDNNWSKDDWEKVRAHFRNEGELDKKLPLFLLWDSCKECGENYNDE